MIKTLFTAFLFLAFIVSKQAMGQDAVPPPEPRPKGLPDIPGSIVLEFGFNQPLDAPDTFDIGFWGSRSVNVYYQLDKRIGSSKFSVHPGFGFSLERYKLKNNYTLAGTAESTALVPAADFYAGVKKSMLITNFVEIPVEIRFSTKPDDPGRSFKVSVGGRVGYLFDSFVKIKYSEDGETRKVKDKQNFNLSKLRYGAFFKLGAGNIGIVSYYNLSTLFDEGEGPEETEMSNFTIGISLSSF
ncbi:MAG TPA: outer membrane beta-barrel protein [Cyclobacteriaceae bacterium]|jgi:hypothetical protein